MNKQKNTKRKIGMNIGLAFLSLLCALALWAYVTVIEDPTNEKTIVIQPSIIGEDMGRFAANDLVVLDRGSEVTLIFTGRQSDLNKLNSNNVSAEVYVRNIIQTGEQNHSYEVIIPDQLKGRVNYSRIQQNVKINVDRMLTKPIKVELHGEVDPAENYTLRQPVCSPEYINVRGPQSIINQIVEARVDVGLTEPLDKTVSVDMPYMLCDAEGYIDTEHIDTGDIDTVNVTYSVYLRKEVPLALSFVDGGGLTEDKNINYQIEPATITIVGDPEQVEAINQIYLGQSILLENLLTNMDENFPIILPNGITAQSSEITEARVKVTIHGIETKQITVSGRIRGFHEEGFRVELINPYIDITLRGSSEAIGKINSSMINAYVDLTGVNITLNSLFDYPLVVDISNLTDVGVIGGPYDVTVRKVALTDIDEEEP